MFTLTAALFPNIGSIWYQPKDLLCQYFKQFTSQAMQLELVLQITWKPIVACRQHWLVTFSTAFLTKQVMSSQLTVITHSQQNQFLKIKQSTVAWVEIITLFRDFMRKTCCSRGCCHFKSVSTPTNFTFTFQTQQQWYSDYWLTLVKTAMIYESYLDMQGNPQRSDVNLELEQREHTSLNPSLQTYEHQAALALLRGLRPCSHFTDHASIATALSPIVLPCPLLKSTTIHQHMATIIHWTIKQILK